MLLDIIILIFLVAIDQYTKYIAVQKLKNQPAFNIINGVLEFNYLQKEKYFKLHILLVMIAGGAIGNLIDRLRFDYVVDFIYIALINFPIFNVADMYVTFSTVLLIFQVLFVYKENDFNFLSFNQNTWPNSE